MNPLPLQTDFDLGPIIYFYTHSLLIIAVSAVVFMTLGVWIGWLTWARFRRRARAYQEECDLLRHEIAALKRRIGEETVGPAPLVLINEDAPMPPVADHGPPLPGFEPTEVLPPVQPAAAGPPKESLASVVLGPKGAVHHTHEPAAPPDAIAELPPGPVVAVSLPILDTPLATNGAHPPAAPAAAGQKASSPMDVSTAFADELASGAAVADPRLGVLLRSQPERWDDLTLLRGVGEVLQQRLHDSGVHTFKQIAYWTEGNVEEFSSKIDARDRIRREHWVNQARDMHFLKYGEKLG